MCRCDACRVPNLAEVGKEVRKKNPLRIMGLPNLPNLPNLFRCYSRTCACVRARTRARARDTKNRLGRLGRLGRGFETRRFRVPNLAVRLGRLGTPALFAVGLLCAPWMAMAGGEFDGLFQKHARAQGVDWRLLKAIAMVESSLNPKAEHPNGLSSGLMQVYCAPAHAPVCTNRFDITDWPPPGRAALYEPERNVHYGAQIIAWNVRRYGLARGVAVYNQWGARLTPAGQAFPNQPYVDAVLARYTQLRGER